MPINIYLDRSHIYSEIGRLKASKSTVSRKNERLIRLMASQLETASTTAGHIKNCSFFFNHVPLSIEQSRETQSMTVNFKHHETEKSFKLDALISCIGYESHPLETSVFGNVPIVKCGWAGTGASGALASTINSSQSCTEEILNLINVIKSDLPNKRSIGDVLKSKNGSYFTWNDWLRFSKFEHCEGYTRNKSAEKIIDPLVCQSIKKLYL